MLMNKALLCCLPLLLLVLSSCNGDDNGVAAALDELLAGQPGMLSELNTAASTIINNPMAAPLFNPNDENTFDFALLSAIDNEGIYLYGGMNLSGVKLHYKGQTIHFEDWPSVSMVYPQMLYSDFRGGGGGRELAIIMSAGRGTGVSIQNLYIVWFDNTGEYNLVYLNGIQAHEQLLNHIYFEDIDITMGNITNFEFVNGAIISTISVHAVDEYIAAPPPFGMVTSTVTLYGDSIILTNHSFEPF